MRLLLVDDDYELVALVRDAINWASIGIDDVRIAYSAAGAKLVFQEHIDVVVSDIEMPRESGLDLIRWAREQRYTCEFIFLTSFDTFGFAREAMKHGAISYVLKPVDFEELTAEIFRAVSFVRMRSSVRENSELWVENRAIVEQKFWRDFLLSDGPVPEQSVLRSRIENRKIEIDFGDRAQLVLIKHWRTLDGDGAAGEGPALPEVRITQLVAEMILKDSARSGRIITYERNGWRYIACVVQKLALAQLVLQCEHVAASCAPDELSILVSDLVDIASLPRQRVALETASQNHYRSGVCLSGSEAQTDASDAVSTVLNVSPFQDLLNRGDRMQLMQDVKRQLEMHMAEGRLSLSNMYAIQQEIYQELVTFLTRRDIPTAFLFTDESFTYLHARAASSIYDMIKWLNYCLIRVLEQDSTRKASLSVTDCAKAYIHEHYQEDITREDVARAVSLAPEYYAKQFKRETGVAVKDYINQHRVEVAKELLRTTEKKVTDIAMDVGFSDSSYFTVVFRKIVGMSPSEYRQEQ